MAAIAKQEGQRTLDLREMERPSAFGYMPEGWPLPKMFGEPVTPNQIKMARLKAQDREIATEDMIGLRTVILQAYGVSDANSKGNAALIIDWLMNADDVSLDEALQATFSNYAGDLLRRVFVA